jgi:hypothetical protein
VLRAFATTGALGAANATATSLPSANYSAIELQSNDRGIPLLLLKRTDPLSGPDIIGGTFSPTATPLTGRLNDGVTIRYVIDRLCNATGSFATLGTSRCVCSPVAISIGGTAGEDRPAVTAPPIYRVTVRVDGPRDTQVFLQSSFSKPE